VNPVFEQLLRNLAGGPHASLRIGGDGTDWTWWPVPGVTPPGGIKFALSRAWLGVARAVAHATGARLIVGVNLEANSTTIAGAEARALLGGIGADSIEGIEIGNEPELYGTFSWYKAADGQHVFGRPSTYGFTDYLQDFSRMADALPDVPLAGPATGAPRWIPELGPFLSAEPRVGVATLHRYPLKHCTRTTHITIPELLSSHSTRGLANSVARYVAVADTHHVPLRIDEMNAVSCGGVRGVSDTFASALWAVDALFEMARVGVAGVNFHTVPRTINELVSADFSGGRWRSTVHPQYYGMLLFAQAAPAGSRLLRVSGPSTAGLHEWATRGRDGRIRVILINDSTEGAQIARVRIAAGRGVASIERLTAPSISSKSGVTLGGQSFGSSTTTGHLAGAENHESVTAIRGSYAVKLPPASAALLTVAAAT
jgi:hypothetical protein